MIEITRKQYRILKPLIDSGKVSGINLRERIKYDSSLSAFYQTMDRLESLGLIVGEYVTVRESQMSNTNTQRYYSITKAGISSVRDYEQEVRV